MPDQNKSVASGKGGKDNVTGEEPLPSRDAIRLSRPMADLNISNTNEETSSRNAHGTSSSSPAAGVSSMATTSDISMSNIQQVAQSISNLNGFASVAVTASGANSNIISGTPNSNLSSRFKRNRNSPNDPNAVKSKKHRYADVVRGLNLVIIHAEFPRRFMTAQEANDIVNFITSSIDNINVEDNFSPRFRGFRYSQGYIHVIVMDLETRSWLTNRLNVFSPIYTVMRNDEMLLIPRMRAWVLGNDLNNNTTLNRLRIQNRAVNFDGWQIIGNRSINGGRLITFVVPAYTANRIAAGDLIIYFGLYILRLSAIMQNGEQQGNVDNE